MACHLCRYVEYNGIKKLFSLYKDDAEKANMPTIKKSYLYYLWRQVLNKGVVEPETGITFTTYVRKNHCRGFAVCTTCEILATDIAQSINEDERECYTRALAEHHEEVNIHDSCVQSIQICRGVLQLG